MSIPVIRQRDIPFPDYTGESVLLPGEPFYRVWVPRERVIVIGNGQNAEKELVVSAVLADRVPVIRRIAGGGAVILDDAVVCYALRIKKQARLQISDYYAAGLKPVRALLDERYALKTEIRGISDLCVGNRKILGCSLYLSKDHALFLGSLLVRDNRFAMNRYLAHPSREPDYRKGRAHHLFTVCLQDLAGESIQSDQIAALLSDRLENTENYLPEACFAMRRPFPIEVF